MTGKNDEWLSRAECSAMRGIAIMAIMLHNYCHWLALAVKENEYKFSDGNNALLLQSLIHPDDTLPIQVLSYFGHYGVPVFLFLSGFGLVMKYEQDKKGMTATRFLHHHYIKLFTMMITGLAAFVIVDAITPGAQKYKLTDIVAQMLMVINFMPEPERSIWPGPYWFFGLMMQLYIVYRLVIYRRRHWGVMAMLVLLCWLPQAMCADSPEGNAINRLRYNCIGGMLPFCAGVMTARLRPSLFLATIRRWQWAAAAVATAAVLTICCFNFHTWLWTPLLVIALTTTTVKALPDAALTPLTWTGGLSAVVFVIHPIFRKILIPISHRGDTYTGLLLYIIATLTVAWMIKRVTDARH